MALVQRKLLPALCLLLLGITPINAGLLGSITATGGIGIPSPAPTIQSLRMSVGLLSSLCFDLNVCAEMFTVNDFDSSIAGTTFVLNASSPGFSTVTGVLTDGVLDIISTAGSFDTPVPAFPGGGSGHYETEFGTSPGPDFAGDTIQSITLQINSLTFTTTSLPNISGQFIPYTIAHVGYTLSVFGDAGAVPEPAAVWLIALGLFLAVVVVRERHIDQL